MGFQQDLEDRHGQQQREALRVIKFNGQVATLGRKLERARIYSWEFEVGSTRYRIQYTWWSGWYLQRWLLGFDDMDGYYHPGSWSTITPTHWALGCVVADLEQYLEEL